MYKILFLIFFQIFFFFGKNIAQNYPYNPFHYDEKRKEHQGLGEALKEPTKVGFLRLNYNENEENLLPKITKLKNLKTLIIESYTLEELMPYLKKLKNLQHIQYFTQEVLYLPKEIGDLKNLTHFECSQNELIALPVELRKLKKLEYFVCSSNELTSIPRELGELTNLKTLILNNNEIKEIPTEIGNLIHLEEMEFSSNKLKNLPKEIGNLKKLKKLFLAGNQLTELPKEIGNLTQIADLGISFNKLQSLPEEIGKLTNLKGLDISTNQLKTLPSTIGDMQNLTYIFATNNKLQSIPKEIQNLNNLTQLNFLENQLTAFPEEISNLPNLEVLTIANNKIKILKKGFLDGFPKLNNFSCENNQIKNLFELLYTNDNYTLSFLNCSQNQIETIHPNIKYLKGLKDLSMFSNNIINLPQEIGELKLLESWTFTDNKLIKLPKEIAQLENLRLVDLSKNCLVDLPKELLTTDKKLEKLMNLNLSYNNFKSIPNEVISFSDLQYFDMSFNKITQLSENITQLKKLYTLNLQNNDLTQVPAYITELTNTTINFSHNKIKTIPTEIVKVLEQTYYRYDFTANAFEQIPFFDKNSFKTKEKTHYFYNFLKVFSKNPIKNFVIDSIIDGQSYLIRDYTTWLDTERKEPPMYDEGMMMMGQNPQKNKKPLKPTLVYNNPNGMKLYNFLRNHYQTIWEDDGLGIVRLEGNLSPEEVDYTENIYVRNLLPIAHLIRIELYGATWFYENKEFASAKQCLEKVKTLLKNFEVASNRFDTKLLENDVYLEETARFDKIDEVKDSFFECKFVKENIQTKVLNYMRETETPNSKNTPEKQKQVEQQEKQKIFVMPILRFFTETLSNFYQDVDALEKALEK